MICSVNEQLNITLPRHRQNPPSPSPPPANMSRRPLLLPLLLFPPLLTCAGAAGNVTCPYDIEEAVPMIPSACYANATSISVTSCCWYVFSAYIFAAARYGNLTGTAFLPPVVASACTTAFSSALVSRRLVHPALLRANGTCSLEGDPVRLAAGNRPCQFSTVAAVRSEVDLFDATLLCASPAVDLAEDQTRCVTCQNAVISAVFNLFNATGSKEFIACGMAATIAIWSKTPPNPLKFQSYAFCMLQVLENVGDLGTGGLVPSPPPPTPPPAKYPNSSRSAAIAAGSAAAGVGSIAVIVSLLVAMRKKKRRKTLRSTDSDSDPDLEPPIGSPMLPTEGIYIFTAAELKQATGDYDHRFLLGEGGSGKVYLGKLPSGQQVAIKRIYREKKIAEFYKEVEILAKLRHRNLATMVGYCVGDREHALVYEYMAGGNLAGVLHHGDLDWRQRLQIAVDVAEGLAYLHEFPVVHRDVKPTNVLLSAGDGPPAKLSDFGVSRLVPAEATHVSTEVRGTMGYVDPDSFASGHVSAASDVYGFGVLLLEMVTGMRAVVPTPTGGAESVVHVARGARSSGVGTIVDPRLGEGWDRASVGAVFEAAGRCVRPYKEERPAMGEVLAELKRVIEDLEARGVVASSPPSVSGGDGSSAPSTFTGGSTPSPHGWSL